VTIATVRDHAVNLEGGGAMTRKRQPVCQACSDAKTSEATRGRLRNTTVN
jgi:hypothetical protein